MAKTPKKTASAPAKKTETREEKFSRLAIPRVTKALKSIDLIGNLSGGNYSYTDEQVAQIFQAVARKVEDTRKKFAPRSKEEKGKDSFAFGG